MPPIWRDDASRLEINPRPARTAIEVRRELKKTPKKTTPKMTPIIEATHTKGTKKDSDRISLSETREQHNRVRREMECTIPVVPRRNGAIGPNNERNVLYVAWRIDFFVVCSPAPPAPPLLPAPLPGVPPASRVPSRDDDPTVGWREPARPYAS